MSDENSVDYLRKLVLDQQSLIVGLEKKVNAALRQAEAAENYSRQDCLIFRGQLNVRPNFSLRDEMMRLIDYHTGVNFPSWCINTVHWLGNGQSLIIRFNNKTVRENIYRNRVPKDPRKRGLFIHESLTVTKMDLVKRCSKLRSDGKISTYYTQGGNVFIKRVKDSPSILVTPGMTDADILTRLGSQPGSYKEAVAQPAKTAPKVNAEAAGKLPAVQSQPGQKQDAAHEPEAVTEVRLAQDDKGMATSSKDKNGELQKGEDAVKKLEGDEEEKAGTSKPIQSQKKQAPNQSAVPNTQGDSDNKSQGTDKDIKGQPTQPGTSNTTASRSNKPTDKKEAQTECSTTSDSDSELPKSSQGQIVPTGGKGDTSASTPHNLSKQKKSKRHRYQNKK